MSSRFALSEILLSELTDEVDPFGAAARVSPKCWPDLTNFRIIAARTGCMDALQGLGGAETRIPHASMFAS